MDVSYTHFSLHKAKNMLPEHFINLFSTKFYVGVLNSLVLNILFINVINPLLLKFSIFNPLKKLSCLLIKVYNCFFVNMNTVLVCTKTYLSAFHSFTTTMDTMLNSAYILSSTPINIHQVFMNANQCLTLCLEKFYGSALF